MAEYNQTYNHIASKNLSIFPFSKYRINNLNNNLFYEQNIANIINQIIDPNLNGFIIDAPETVADIKEDSIVKLNLKGYHIEITDVSSYITNGNLYIAVVLTDKIDNYPQEINGQDEDNLFTGVLVNDIVIEGHPCIQIYKNGKVCKENFARFNVNSLNITGIDGKHQ